MSSYTITQQPFSSVLYQGRDLPASRGHRRSNAEYTQNTPGLIRSLNTHALNPRPVQCKDVSFMCTIIAKHVSEYDYIKLYLKYRLSTNKPILSCISVSIFLSCYFWILFSNFYEYSTRTIIMMWWIGGLSRVNPRLLPNDCWDKHQLPRDPE